MPKFGFGLLVLAVALCLGAQDPVDYRGWLNQGVQQFKAQDYAAAIVSFERAAAMDPSKPVVHLYLGTAYMQQVVPGAVTPENQVAAQRAEQSFRRVLDIEPRNTVALSSLASLNLNQKKWDDALGWYEKLIVADPSNADAYYTLGFIAWSKWYPPYSQARSNAGLRPEAPGPLPDPSVRQAMMSQYGPMLQAGIDALNKALDINPQYDDAMAYMNLLIRERADLRDSVAEWRQDVETADQWVQKALAAKKAKAAARSGGGTGFAAPPPPPPPPGSSAAASARPDMPKRIRIGGNVQEAKLITRVPPAASTYKGTVVLNVVIDKTGSVREIQVVDGHPMLIQLSLDAVKQWKYQATLLNGEPVEVETQVTLNY